MAIVNIGIKLASKLKREAVDIMNGKTITKIGKAIADHPWTAAFNTAIAGMSIPDIEELWDYVQSATGQEVDSVESMIDIIANDSNIQNLVLEKTNSMMPEADSLFRLIPPIWREKHTVKAKILADQWHKRRETLDGKSVIRATDNSDEQLLRIATIENVSSFFGVHSPEGIRALHSSLRAFVNTSAESIERTLKIKEGM